MSLRFFMLRFFMLLMAVFMDELFLIRNGRLHLALFGGGGGYDAGAVQLGGLVHEAHNITWDHI